MRIFCIVILIFSFHFNSFGQVILLEEFFQDTVIVYSAPPGSLADTNWYSYDQDTLIDGSGESRPAEWYIGYPFSSFDSVAISGETNLVLRSSSVFTSPGKAKNWLISPSIDMLPIDAVLTWYTTPISTPYKLDGFKVIVSTTTNDLSAFTDTLFIASEYNGPGIMGGNYDYYDFEPNDGWIHGWDGSTIQPAEIEYNGDSSQMTGVLTQHSVCLNYPSQTIFIAFVHDSYDDNLISLDDVRIYTGCFGGTEEENQEAQFNVYPNPSYDGVLNIETNLGEGVFDFSLIEITGKVIYSTELQSGNAMVRIPENMHNGIYICGIKNNQTGTLAFKQKIVLIK